MPHTRYVIDGDAAEIGYLVIDWDTRQFRVHGVAGDRAQRVTLADLRTAVQEAGGDEGRSIVPFVVWPENADGHPQLACYDLASIAQAIEEDGGDDADAA